MPRLLVIEDHKNLLKSLQRGLIKAGYEVAGAETGADGFYAATTEPFDAIVLDRMLPDRDGLEVLRNLRASGFSRPILILSARDAVSDRVAGLDAGADDYLIKPFAFEELLARLRALQNRAVPGRRAVLSAGDLELHVATQQALRGDAVFELSKRETRLLEYLLRHHNQPVTREDIARDVWNQPGGTGTNVVDVYVNALRKKLERPGLKRLIHTVRGVGYVLGDEPGVAEDPPPAQSRRSSRKRLQPSESSQP